MSNSYVKFIDEVEYELDMRELYWEYPMLLLGSGMTLDSLGPPPTKQQEWVRKHRDHKQEFICLGKDEYGLIMYWGCADCRVPEPDCVEHKGVWA